MTMWLKQSTAATVKLGPFLDDTDGKTAETALTISQADIRLAKNGGDIAQSNNATGATHDELGYYDVPLDTTDTNTLGRLKIAVHESGALPVWQEFMVVPAQVWDSLFGADKLQVHADEITNGLITSIAIATNAIDADALATDAVTEIQSGLARTTELPAAPDNAGIADIKTKTDNLPVDTAAVLTAIAQYIDTEIAAIKAKTDNLPASPAATTDIPTPPTAIAIADAVLGRSVSNIDNTASTHSLYELIQAILEGNTSTGSWVVYKTNGSTVFNTRTLATDPNAEPIVGVS